MCILHNLTFQLEAEAPALFSRIMFLGKAAVRTSSQDETGPIGCFSPHSKLPVQKVKPAGGFLTRLDLFFCQHLVRPAIIAVKSSLSVQQNVDFLDMEEGQPSGAALLIHSKTLQSYLSVLNSSQKEETQEACCGVLQNLTTNEGIVSCQNAVWLLRSAEETWISAPAGVCCDEPDNRTEAQRPSSPQSTFAIKQSQPAEECDGSDRKLGKEPQPAQCHR